MRKLSLGFVALLLALAPAGAQQAQDKARPVLTLEAVQVEPAAPGPDTLCRLRIKVRNAGTRRASAFELTVKVNGKELPAYKNRLYLDPVEPGATEEIRLFNFWSTEGSRPAPADGKLTVEVTLDRASWVNRETKDGAEVWSPLGPVEGLPATKSVTLTMGKAGR